MDHEMFSPQVEALSGEFRVDRLGRPRLRRHRVRWQAFDYWDNARDCLGLLDHLA